MENQSWWPAVCWSFEQMREFKVRKCAENYGFASKVWPTRYRLFAAQRRSEFSPAFQGRDELHQQYARRFSDAGSMLP